MQALTDAVATYGPGVASLAGNLIMHQLLLLELHSWVPTWAPDIHFVHRCNLLMQVAMTLKK